jgi:hypothetical protein
MQLRLSGTVPKSIDWHTTCCVSLNAKIAGLKDNGAWSELRLYVNKRLR